MLSLFRPFRAKTNAAAKRSEKTPGALYRVLSQDFERTRSCGCSCRMPMVFERERGSPEEPNWGVETLWHGCDRCRATLAEVIRRNSLLFDMKSLATSQVTAAFAPNADAL